MIGGVLAAVALLVSAAFVLLVIFQMRRSINGGSKKQPSAGKPMRSLEGDLSDGIVQPSNRGISLEQLEPEDPRDIAEAIEKHMREEWANQKRRR